MPINYPPLIQLDHQIGGNTAGVTADISVGTYVLVGGNNITLSQNANTVTISGGAGGAGDGGNILAAGTRTAGSNSSVLFSNLNGVSFGLDAVNGSIMTASHNAITTAMASNRGSDFVQATAAFAGTSASGTIASNGISVSIGPYITTAALSNHSHGNPTLALTSLSGTTASASNGFTLSLAAGPYITTAALSNHSHGNPTLALTNLSGTTASASDGLTLSLSAAAPGGGAGATVSRFDYMLGEPIAGTTSLTAGGSSVFVEPIFLPLHISASYLRIPISAGFGSSTFASTANTTCSLIQSLTQFFCIYSQGVGASSKSIQSLYSSSVSMQLNVVYLVGAASGNQSCSHAITYPLNGASSTTFSTSYAPAASSILRVSTTHLTAFTGAVFMDIPIATLIVPGAYWIAFQSSSATAVTGVAGMNQLTSRGSYIAMSQVSSNIHEMGANTTVGSNMWQGDGHGWWTTNTLGATTASMALSQISTIANQPLVPFRFDRHA